MRYFILYHNKRKKYSTVALCYTRGYFGFGLPKNRKQIQLSSGSKTEHNKIYCRNKSCGSLKCGIKCIHCENTKLMRHCDPSKTVAEATILCSNGSTFSKIVFIESNRRGAMHPNKNIEKNFSSEDTNLRFNMPPATATKT